jgi:hypothetical protein
VSANQATKISMFVSAAKATDWLASRRVFVGEGRRWD